MANGDLCFGYERCRLDRGCPGPTCGGGVHPVPAEAKAVREAFRRFIAGEQKTAIARGLNGMGFRTRNRIDHGRGAGPQLFTTWSLRDLLANPFYAGKVRWNPRGAEAEVFDGAHKAIVSESLFLQAQALKANHLHRSRAFSRARRPYLLKGLLACAECGQPFWCESREGRSYCRGPRGRGDCSCASRMLRCEEVDARLGLIVYALTLPSDWLDRARVRVAIGNGASRRSRQAGLEERRRRLATAYVDGAYTDAEYRRELTALDGELAAVRAEPAPADARIAAVALLRDLEALWLTANLEERHKLLTALVEAVYVDHAGRIVGIAPKAAMVPVFAALATKAETGVMIGGMEPSPTPHRNEPENASVGRWRRGRIELPVQKKSAQDLLQA